MNPINLIKSKNVKNAGWIIGAQGFQMVASLVIGLLSARYLGPKNYGSMNYTASFVSFSTALVTLGMDGVVIKKIIDKPEQEGVYLGSCISLRFFSALLCTAAITLLVKILNPNDPTKLVLVALQSVQLLFLAFYLFDSWFQRHLQSKYVSIAKMAACVIVSGYRIYLLVTQKSVQWFAFSNSLTYIVVAMVLLVFYKMARGQRLQFRTAAGTEVLKESYHFILSGLMVAIYGQMDKIMLQQMMTDTDVGYYTTASAICDMWIFVPIAIINSFQPTIMELKRSGNEKMYMRRLQQLYSFIIWLCLIVTILVFAFAPVIVRVLYGKAYLGAVAPLRVSIWYELFSMIGTARGIWILCENKNKYVKYYLGIGVVINLVLNFYLIPVWGTSGASFATLVTQIFTSLIAPLCFKETRVHTKIVAQAFLLKWYFDQRRERKAVNE